MLMIMTILIELYLKENMIKINIKPQKEYFSGQVFPIE
jgi:hypothetical protein